MYFPLDEYHGRWERVYACLEGLGLESAVVFGRSAGTHEKCADVLYLTNYYSNQSGHSDDDEWIGIGYSAVVLHRRGTAARRRPPASRARAVRSRARRSTASSRPR